MRPQHLQGYPSNPGAASPAMPGPQQPLGPVPPHPTAMPGPQQQRGYPPQLSAMPATLQPTAAPQVGQGQQGAPAPVQTQLAAGNPSQPGVLPGEQGTLARASTMDSAKRLAVDIPEALRHARLYYRARPDSAAAGSTPPTGQRAYASACVPRAVATARHAYLTTGLPTAAATGRLCSTPAGAILATPGTASSANAVASARSCPCGIWSTPCSTGAGPAARAAGTAAKWSICLPAAGKICLHSPSRSGGLRNQKTIVVTPMWSTGASQ